MHIRRYVFWFGFICLGLAAGNLLKLHTNATSDAALVALLASYAGGPLSLDAQARSSECVVDGPLPDHDCTPGAVFADATPEKICTPGYSKSVRNVSVTTKKQIYAAYGISYPQPTGTYEVDHLIPLELGGSNDPSNLFPEAAVSAPVKGVSTQLGFHEKDVVEDYLHDEVCAGRITLAAAQKQIATDWVTVYHTIPPKVVSTIKSRYRNWAD